MTTIEDAATLTRDAGLGQRVGARVRALPRRALAVLGLAVAAALLGGTWIALPAASVSTDDAYLKADNTIVAPKVRGLVEEVLVQENTHVKAGDILIRIDAEDYAQAVKSAEADLASAEALLAQQSAHEALAAANVTASATAIRSADAERHRAEIDARRYNALADNSNIPRRDAERVRATAIAAVAAADKARADLAARESEADVVAHTRAQLVADVAKAEAALSLARLNLEHATVRAPVSGIVGDRQVQIGEYVQPGTQLMRIVPTDTIYVSANFKETQTGRMRVGQPVEIEIDALPGHDFHGEVESFAPASGSEFALLPFEPATGNFTRIVQRLPVRVRLLPGQEGADRLRPGLSAKVTVDLTDD
jgi:membrane fusion protein (multidrug efflux system)